MKVLLLTGTCGSGKSTIAALLGKREGWAHLSEDDIWAANHGRNRGAFGSAEHRAKRSQVQEVMFGLLEQRLAANESVAIDVTLHESPPDGFEAYGAYLNAREIDWAIRVLHPTLAVAVARDAQRPGRSIGEEGIATLRAKFSGRVFQPQWFMDTSVETAEQSVERLLREGVA